MEKGSIIEKHRQKAVGSHHENAGLFQDRYEALKTDPYANAFVYGRKKLFEHLFSLLKESVPSGGKVLDAGCGTGYLLGEMKKMGYEPSGLEPAEGMRQRAQEANPGIFIQAGEITKLPFAPETFDAVTAIEVLRYLPENDILSGYRECLRVLRPGGIFIFTLVNRFALDGFIFKYYLRVLLEKLIGREAVNYCHFDTPGGIEKLFNTEFKREAVTYGAMFAPLRLVYLINNSLGRMTARTLERLDNWLSGQGWHRGLAGHLLVIVKKR